MGSNQSSSSARERRKPLDNNEATTTSILSTPRKDFKSDNKTQSSKFISFKTKKRSQSVRENGHVSSGGKGSKIFRFKGRRSTISSDVVIRSPQTTTAAELQVKVVPPSPSIAKSPSAIFTIPEGSSVVVEQEISPEQLQEDVREKVSKIGKLVFPISPWRPKGKSPGCASIASSDPGHFSSCSPAHPPVTMAVNVEKLAKELVTLSRQNGGGDKVICRNIFQRHVIPHSTIAEIYLWSFFGGDGDKLKPQSFIQAAEQINNLIFDKDQRAFYVKVFAGGDENISKSAFQDLLVSAYHLSSSTSGSLSHQPKQPIPDPDFSNDKFKGKEWIQAVIKSVFHIKEEMSTFFVTNWLQTNLPRLTVPMHKYLIYQLTVGHAKLQRLPSETSAAGAESPGASSEEAEEPTQPDEDDEISNPVLMWLLHASLPQIYTALFHKKPEVTPRQLTRMNSVDMLKKLLNNDLEIEQWSPLYNSNEHGLSINRFQFHVFNYRGPTLMFVHCEGGYVFLIGADVEWRENCHFWGNEQAFVAQLAPEFRFEEVGAKSLYTNFSIRGYPFGMQFGKDPKKLVLEITPDFDRASFKKIPCQVNKLTVWGCSSSPARAAQTEHKKWEAKECEKQKKIDRSKLDWNDNPDKYLLELAGSYRSYTERK